jgi:hypothetical protein
VRTGSNSAGSLGQKPPDVIVKPVQETGIPANGDKVDITLLTTVSKDRATAC